MKTLLYAALIAIAVANLSQAENISKKTERLLRQLRSLTNYGRWCGPENTQIGRRGCSCRTSESTCKRRYRPIDDLDAACLKHDFCAHCSPIAETSLLRFCQCEERLYNEAREAYCRTVKCRLYKIAVQTIFRNIPCICRSRVVGNFRKC